METLKFRKNIKKIFLLVVLIATGFAQTGFAQQEQATGKASGLLPSYYNVKDALVTGNAALAAAKAAELVKVISDTDEKIVNKTAKESLLKHAGRIAASKDLKNQREHFSAVSEDIIALAKTTKLSDTPSYQMYCPMKKTNWLSSEKTVKNPYYGSAMLTCGKVVGTINNSP
jgi:hypothetical protein